VANHRISGTTAATAATDQHAIAAIWNPSSTVTIAVREISVVAFAAPGAGAGFVVRRISGRGTAGSSVTSAAANCLGFARTASQSGFILDLATYSIQPTLIAGDLDAWVLAAVAASGIVKPYPEGIDVPAGEGLVIVNRAAIIFPTSEVSFLVSE
jgi:hypothetical protein